MANKKVKFELTAVDKTKAAFDKVTKGLKTVGGAAASASKGVAGVGLAATATAGALAILVQKSFDFIDAIGKTSTRTGIATSTIQAFHLAARESGTNIEGANKALEKFARSVGDAQRGLKTQQDIFKAINVELVDAAGNYKTTDQILEETAEGISKLGSQTEKATALANLFGRQGILLTSAIEDLSEKGLDKFIERAERLGIVLSEKVIRRTEAFNDAVGVIKMQIGSFVNNITTSFLPVFEDMQEKIAAFIQTTIDEAGGMDALALKIANAIIEFTATAIENFGVFRDQFAQMINDAEFKLKELQIAFAQFNINLLRINPFKDMSDEIAILKEQIFLTNNEMLVINARTSNFGKQAKKTADEVRGYKLTVDDLIDSNNKLGTGTNNTVDSMFDAMNTLTAYKNSLKEVGESLDSIAVNSMKKFEDSIVEGLKTGKLAFKDFADYVVDQLIRVAIQQLVIAQIVDPFRKFLGGFDLFGGKQTKPSLDVTEGKFFGYEGGGYTGMGARAGGIDGRGGFPAILHPNETVIDHTKGQGMGATVNFNISTVDAAGFDQLLASRKGLITSIINNAMNNQGKMGVI